MLEVPARQAPWIAEGQVADITCAELAGPRAVRRPRPGGGRARTEGGWEYLRTTVAIDDPPREIKAGMIAVVHFKAPMAALEPFRSLP